MTENRPSPETKGPIAWMAGNSVAANLMMLVLLIGGLVIGSQIRQEVFPEFETGIVTVSVRYPGASPEEVERGIILAVEEAVQGLDGLDEMRSTASEGIGTISLEVLEDVNVQSFAQQVESEVDGITSFPDEAEPAMISVVSRRREVITAALYGDVSPMVLREITEEFRDLLLQDESITQVSLSGIRDYEIHIEVPQENLRRYGLTLKQVADRIRETSVELPGGSLKTGSGEILVRMKERKELAREYAKLPVITTSTGARIRLDELAIIKEDFSDSNTYAVFNGKPAIIVNVYRVGDQKPVEISDAVKEEIAQFKQNLPPAVDIAIISDRSEIFTQRAALLIKNGYIGLSLVFLLLALFLEIRLAFWVALGIPISILGSFLLLSTTDFTINIISMFAFIVTLGIVVDDAIVVGENIYSYRQQGHSFFSAAVEGTREVAMPVVFSILTNVVAFMPIMFVTGIMGKFFRIIPMVVISVFLISLAESLFILPAHLAHGNPKPPRGLIGWIINRQQSVSRGLVVFINRVYDPILHLVIRNRYASFAIGISLLIIMTAYIRTGRIATTLMPRVESDYAFVKATLPYGSSDSRVSEVLDILTKAARDVIGKNGGEALSVGLYSTVSGNVIDSSILLTPPDVRPLSTTAVADLWRTRTGEIPGIESITYMSDRGGPGSGTSLTVELSHRDISILEEASLKLAQEIATFPAARDIDDGSAKGKQQYNFQMKPEGEYMGLDAREVALQVRHAFYGIEALKLQRGRNEVTVLVRLPEKERTSENTLDTLMVYSPSGGEALLRSVVTMDPGRAFTSIERKAGRRIATISANVVPRVETSRIIADLAADVLPVLKQDYPGLTSQFEGRQARMKESTDSLFRGLAIALFVIYALLAVPFKSYIQPLIIMLCIPFGIVGAVLGHIALGYSLSLMSLFGLVALAGVVVNDSLVMIDFANRKQRKGIEPFDAIKEAAKQRFRPIMLTTLTTFGGLAPMIFETSRQARYLIPMAISLGFGILFGTIITLILVPTLYMIIEDILALVGFKGTKPLSG